MRAVVYLRQSLDRAGDGAAVDRQREGAHQLAEVRGYELVGEHVDNDTSAAGKRHRPGFEATIEAIESGHAQAVIAWDMTRLTRNRRDTLRVLEVGERHGVTLAFVRGSDMDLATPAGRLSADILSGVARHEIDQKSDRQRAANAQAIAQGRRIGGRRPFGYESDGETLRPVEATALARVYREVLGGMAVGSAARMLNEQGLPTPQRRRDGSPSPWTAQSLRTTVLNPRYGAWHEPVDGREVGTRAVGDEVSSRDWRIIGPAVWPPVVDAATWEAVDRLLRDSGRRTNAPRYRQRLLTGVAWCGWPGCTSLVHAGANPKGQPTYRCRDTGKHISRRSDPVDEYVGMIVVERMSRPDAADLLVDHDLPDLDRMRTERGELRDRRRSLARLVADGTFTESEVREEVVKLDRQIDDLSARMEHPRRADALADLAHSPDPGRLWPTMDVGRQRAAVDALMTVRLLPLGRGVRRFRPESVEITPKRG